jgi:hypothetical protein
MYKARTWRDFIAALPEEYQGRFEGQFENDSDLDRGVCLGPGSWAGLQFSRLRFKIAQGVVDFRL